MLSHEELALLLGGIDLDKTRRESVTFLRDAGIDISRATIDGWVMRVGDLLTPLVGVMDRELVGGSYIQADDRAPADRSSSVGW